MVLVEPVAGVERRITNRFHLNLALSYRLSRGVDQPGLRDGDINAVAVALAAKFGRF
jgi:hypothetical protein